VRTHPQQNGIATELRLTAATTHSTTPHHGKVKTINVFEYIFGALRKALCR
jgi:hypothetical protein